MAPRLVDRATSVALLGKEVNPVQVSFVRSKFRSSQLSIRVFIFLVSFLLFGEKPEITIFSFTEPKTDVWVPKFRCLANRAFPLDDLNSTSTRPDNPRGALIWIREAAFEVIGALMPPMRTSDTRSRLLPKIVMVSPNFAACGVFVARGVGATEIPESEEGVATGGITTTKSLATLKLHN
jgi:hypothetical protein